MRILAIETSCDETAVAVVEDGTKVLSNVLASSAETHALTGGIIPEDAARKQIQSIIPTIQLALKKAFPEFKPSTDNPLPSVKIDAIAVTYGPGLIGSLLVGVETARSLSYLWNKPLIPVNHLVAHIYANWIDDTIDTTHHTPQFPAVALVVSGGHTDLVLMKDHGNLKWIGGTRDDAAGEAFDKTARLLGIDYPGGPLLAKTADQFIENNPDKKLNLFPRPMMNQDNYDWSFSGLKTATLNKVKEIYLADKPKGEVITFSDYKKVSKDQLVKQQVPMLAAEIQEAIVEVLVKKSLRSIEVYKPKSFLLAGGVAANSRLRESFTNALAAWKMKTQFHVSKTKYCTDNAAVIASFAFFNNNPVDWRKIKANPQLTISDSKV